LRTPIAVLHGETELLLSKPRTAEEYQKTLAVFDDELKSSREWSRGFLHFPSPMPGNCMWSLSRLHQRSFGRGLRAVSSRGKRKGIAILRQLDQELPYTGDEAFLHQLFLIFLDNAIKYSPDRSTIHVTLEQFDGAIRVCFQDHGIGISAQHLPFIFERFIGQPPPQPAIPRVAGWVWPSLRRSHAPTTGLLNAPAGWHRLKFYRCFPLIPTGKIDALEPSKQKLIMG